MDSVLEVLEEIRQHPLHVSGPQEPGGRQFIARFRLGRQTAFGRLVSELATGLVVLSERSDFARGAYEFWRRVYARELNLEEAPRSWRDLVPAAGRDDLYRFMFALETAYVLLARVLLAKAEARSDVGELVSMLEEIEKNRGLELGSFKIIPLVETAKGVVNAYEIASASERIVAGGSGAFSFLLRLATGSTGGVVVPT